MARRTPRFNGTVRVGQYRVLSAHLAYVMFLLRSQGAQKAELRRMELGVITATTGDNMGMPRAPGISDPTAAASVRLDDSKERSYRARAHLRLTLNSVQEAYRKLPADEQRILRDLYLQPTKTVFGVAQALGKSRATICRKRNQALADIAVALIGEDILMPVQK